MIILSLIMSFDDFVLLMHVSLDTNLILSLSYLSHELLMFKEY